MMGPAHPRSRGENGEGRADDILRARLIPAHAGKTWPGWRGRRGSAAHPRSRGENLPCEPAAPELVGSSPLTRGKRGSGRWPRRNQGLIPAHAGKTDREQRPGDRDRAHPRSRGENGQDGHDEGAPAGSSPLTRGKRPRGRSLYRCPGLIPAHAGKTARGQSPRRGGRAHPRSRGENINSRRPLNSRAGSSPLTRGKLRVSVRLVAWLGLIPAHAGKTEPKGPRP